jgi:hypothetical protein
MENFTAINLKNVGNLISNTEVKHDLSFCTVWSFKVVLFWGGSWYLLTSFSIYNTQGTVQSPFEFSSDVPTI